MVAKFSVVAAAQELSADCVDQITFLTNRVVDRDGDDESTKVSG